MMNWTNQKNWGGAPTRGSQRFLITFLHSVFSGRGFLITDLGSNVERKKPFLNVMPQVGKGGGLICMSSNTIHSEVKPENYVAMVKAIREYSKYPIAL